MFIGSGPGSTAGGLRTTTVAILFLSIIARAKNQEQVSVFNRSVSKKQSFDAAMIFIASVILVFASSIIITAVESTAAVDSKAFLDYFFLTNSAYGTTGLSTLSSGAIHNLHVVSKLNIILLMFVGQLGIITTMKNMGVTTSKKEKARIKYIEESVNLGH
jgi:Trk-type K+ transport system membrane component